MVSNRTLGSKERPRINIWSMLKRYNELARSPWITQSDRKRRVVAAGDASDEGEFYCLKYIVWIVKPFLRLSNWGFSTQALLGWCFVLSNQSCKCRVMVSSVDLSLPHIWTYPNLLYHLVYFIVMNNPDHNMHASARSFTQPSAA